jgi:protein TonB
MGLRRGHRWVRRTAAWTVSLSLHALAGLVALGWYAESVERLTLLGDLHARFASEAVDAMQPIDLTAEPPAPEVEVVVTPAQTAIDRHVMRPATTRVSHPTATELALVIDQPRDVEPAAPVPARSEPPKQPAIERPLPRRSRPPDVSGQAQPAAPSVASSLGHVHQTPARLLHNYPPQYPLPARQARLEGSVLLRLHVSASGQVERVEIIATSGHEILDGAAVQAVRQWRFEPARRNGQSIATVVRQPVHFTLE